MSSLLSQYSFGASGRLAELLSQPEFSGLLRLFARSGWLRLILCLSLGIGAVRQVNNLLSRAVLNNFSRDDYNWRREVVVVTGGSGGLGDMLVRKLAKNCIKVISLDVIPPKNSLRTSAALGPLLSGFVLAND